jgi:hypothetical protein
MTVSDTVLPPSRRLVAMYADPARRGYLAPLVKDVPRERVLEAILEKAGVEIKDSPKNKK